MSRWCLAWAWQTPGEDGNFGHDIYCAASCLFSIVRVMHASASWELDNAFVSA